MTHLLSLGLARTERCNSSMFDRFDLDCGKEESPPVVEDLVGLRCSREYGGEFEFA